MLSGRTSLVNGQDQIIQKGKYSYLSMRLASVDVEAKRNIQWMITNRTCKQYAGKKGARFSEIGSLALMFEKSAIEPKPELHIYKKKCQQRDIQRYDAKRSKTLNWADSVCCQT